MKSEIVIWKYMFEDPDKPLIIDLPISAQIISAKVQIFRKWFFWKTYKIVVYVKLNKNAPVTSKYKFVAYRTGAVIDMEEINKFHPLDTVLIREGELMFHVFYAHESEI